MNVVNGLNASIKRPQQTEKHGWMSSFKYEHTIFHRQTNNNFLLEVNEGPFGPKDHFLGPFEGFALVYDNYVKLDLYWSWNIAYMVLRVFIHFFFDYVNYGLDFVVKYNLDIKLSAM